MVGVSSPINTFIIQQIIIPELTMCQAAEDTAVSRL